MPEPTLINPVGMETQREADALFSELKHFTPANTFTAELSTGITMAYTLHSTQVAGAGVDDEEQVLLITGFMNGKEAYAPIIDLLEDKWIRSGIKKNLTMVAFDNRGSGGTSSPWGYYSTSTLAMDAVALMDALGWEKAHIVGPSLGGMIALELAVTHPERIRSLSLMLTSRGKFSTKGANDFILSMITTLTERALIQKSLEFFYPKEALAKPLKDSTETVGDVLRRFHEERMKDVASQRVGTFLRQSIATRTHFVSDERLASLGDASFPIMVMGCAEDTMIPGEEAIKIWRTIGSDKARLVFYDKAGHLVMVQCPNEVTQEIFATIVAGSGA